MRPEVEIFQKRNSQRDRFRDKESDIDIMISRDKREEINANSSMSQIKDVGFDIDREEARNSMPRRRGLTQCVDLIIFVLSIILTFLIGTLIDLTVLIGLETVIALTITVALLLILRIIIITVYNRCY